ncbi:MAG: DNA polymerase I [Clostridia bacterium]|nr:DNA polymerase I [Clostridia bacterium]
MRDTFLLVDGNSLMHRAFHALPLMDADGIYTNAIYGFLNMLLKVIREEEVRYIAVCFDEHGPTFRHTAYPDYKAGRSATPDELRQQFRTIRDLLTDMGVKWFTLMGWEADDLLGTLSLKGAAAGAAPLLLTGDRDALQLVDGTTELMFTRKGISETIRFTPAKVHEEYGFSPEQVTDWKGLAGDSSDNIPGVPGVGDKTAVKLLHQYGTLENILAHAGEVKGKLGEKLQTWQDQARMCKELATIRRDAPIPFTLAECALPDLQQSVPALKKLRLNSLVKRITGEAAAASSAAAGTDSAVNTAEEIGAPVLLPFGEAADINAPDELHAWLNTLTAKSHPLALHVGETTLSIAAQDGACASVSLGGNLLMPGLDPSDVLSALAPLLCAQPAIVHDGKRLWHQLNKLGLPLPDRFYWDTMLGAYLINPQEKSYSLSSLRGELPEDARGVASLAAWQQRKITADQMLHLMQDVEMPLSRVLFNMEQIGFRVDTSFLRTLGDRYISDIETAKRDFYAACSQMAGQSVKPINLNSTQQLGDLLFDQLGLPHGKKTTRGYSTSAEVLENLRDIAPEIIDPLLRYRQLTKLNSTYIEGLLRLTGAHGRVHSTFDQVATATGRISSSEPNLQNIPVRTEEGREIRQAFLPREGWVLLDADYSQIELRLMAHFSGDTAMLEAFQTGQDVHARIASEIFEVPLEEVDSTLRSRAKAVNFGLIYGISGFGLARNTGVSQQEARSFINRYFAKYPGVKRFMESAVVDGSNNGYALTLMGRRRYLPELQASNAMTREFGKRAAMNTPVQGTAADIIKLAMVRVDEALRREGLQSRLILQVHDELLLECPPEEVEAAARLLQEAMEGVITLAVPLQAEVHEGANWAEAK